MHKIGAETTPDFCGKGEGRGEELQANISGLTHPYLLRPPVGSFMSLSIV